MARVIYTGPLNHVIFARAKKEAEKAERIKGYTPRVIKTPTHTVVYNKTGPEVKAVVMDMLAPITFSTPDSAIPISPNLLALNENLPIIKYGDFRYAELSGDQKHFASNYYSAGYNKLASVKWLTGYDGVVRDIYAITSNFTVPGFTDIGDAAEHFLGELPHGIAFVTHNLFVSNTGNKSFVEARSIASANDGAFYNEYTIDSSITGSFLTKNIRLYENGFHVGGKTIQAVNLSIVYNFSNDYSSISNTTYKSESELLDDVNSKYAFDGSVKFSFIKVSSDTNISFSVNFDGALIPTSSGAHTISRGICTNLSTDRKTLFDVKNIDFSEYDTFRDKYYKSEDVENWATLDVEDSFVLVYVISSCGLFDGVLIKCKVFSIWPQGEEIVYDKNSSLITSGLGVYFDIFRSVYSLVEFENNYAIYHPPHLKQPKLTSDGICLPHAWFFCRDNETRETDFYPNNHNRLSIVIYPQGRHEFSVDEAEIVSVELNHTPQFVIKPGGQFSFVLTSFTTKTGPFPYVIDGLVEERDEYGEKTGFYLAQDGVVSGNFSATHTTAEFTLSPRQPIDSGRLVVMAVTTGRATPVVSHVEVFGRGQRAVLPMSIGIECLTEEILAGQAASFYVTCTSVANNSQLPYTIKRGGSFVKSGFFNVTNGASWDTYGPPVASRDVSVGDTVQYVVCDASTAGTAQQSTTYEITVGPDGNQATASFVVVSASERYANSTDRPPAIDIADLPPMFFLQPFYKRDFGDGALQYAAANVQHSLINRIYYSLQSKRVYVLFWDGQSCDVSGILKQNPESGQYEYNPDWKETPFDYPPAADPYNIKGTLEPYVYAYMDYENNRNNGA